MHSKESASGPCRSQSRKALLSRSFQVESSEEKLYTPQGSQAFIDRAYVDSVFRYPDRETDVFVTDPNTSGQNILTKPALLAFLQLYEDLAR